MDDAGGDGGWREEVTATIFHKKIVEGQRQRPAFER